jgi:hypothetical protein
MAQQARLLQREITRGGLAVVLEAEEAEDAAHEAG